MTATRSLAALHSALLVLALTACGGAQPVPEPTPEEAPPIDTTSSGEPMAAPSSGEPSSGEPIDTTSSGEPMAAQGRRCGSRALGPCADNEYCDYPAGSQCGATDAGGVCRVRPEICTREYRPVCGCDGRTHATRCTAASQGVSVSAEGPCPSTPGAPGASAPHS